MKINYETVGSFDLNDKDQPMVAIYLIHVHLQSTYPKYITSF